MVTRYVKAELDGHALEITCELERTQMEDGSWWDTYYIESAELVKMSRKSGFVRLSRWLKMTQKLRRRIVDALTDRERGEVYG